jgi:hypothetical protein
VEKKKRREFNDGEWREREMWNESERFGERKKKKKREMWREREKRREKNGERTGLVFKIMSKKTGLAFKKKMGSCHKSQF